MTIVLVARLASTNFLQARRADTTSAGVEGPILRGGPIVDDFSEIIC